MNDVKGERKGGISEDWIRAVLNINYWNNSNRKKFPCINWRKRPFWFSLPHSYPNENESLSWGYFVNYMVAKLKQHFRKIIVIVPYFVLVSSSLGTNSVKIIPLITWTSISLSISISLFSSWVKSWSINGIRLEIGSSNITTSTSISSLPTSRHLYENNGSGETYLSHDLRQT